MASLKTFSLFNSFPPEIQSLVLSSCTPNDLICLRLTSKRFYNLLPEPKSDPSCETSKSLSLETTECGPLCGKPELTPEWRNRYQHRQECHKHSYATLFFQNMEKGKRTLEMNKKCRTTWSSLHCECYTRKTKLHIRLANWMPKGMRYCGTCKKFTKRKPQHRGRCYHGKPKPRISKPNFWTHTSRNGAFGRKIWKKWFNNQAMNRMESRLNRAPDVRPRAGSARYELRRIEATKVDTRVARDNQSWVWYQ